MKDAVIRNVEVIGEGMAGLRRQAREELRREDVICGLQNPSLTVGL